MYKIIILVVVIFINACSSNLSKLENANLKNDVFKTTLARQYLKYAKHKEKEGYKSEASYFSNKGVLVLSGKDISPESLKKRRVDKEFLPIFKQARSYLIDSINEKTTDLYPEKLAKSMFFFDCWISEQQLGKDSKTIEFCKDSFYENLDLLNIPNLKQDKFQEIKVNKSKTEKPKTSIKCVKNICVSTDERIVYFSLNSAELTNRSKIVIDKVAKKVLSLKQNYSITLNGFADRIGSEEYNIRLSKQRALTVKKQLMKNGLDEKNISVFAFGELQGIIKTENGVIEPENRSVKLIIATY